MTKIVFQLFPDMTRRWTGHGCIWGTPIFCLRTISEILIQNVKEVNFYQLCCSLFLWFWDPSKKPLLSPFLNSVQGNRHHMLVQMDGHEDWGGCGPIIDRWPRSRRAAGRPGQGKEAKLRQDHEIIWISSHRQQLPGKIIVNFIIAHVTLTGQGGHGFLNIARYVEGK